MPLACDEGDVDLDHWASAIKNRSERNKVPAKIPNWHDVCVNLIDMLEHGGNSPRKATEDLWLGALLFSAS